MFTCSATTAFGLEAPLKREITNLGATVISTHNGSVYFHADKPMIIKANLWLRTAEHVHIVLARETVKDFNALFNFIEALPFGNYLHKDGRFVVNARSNKSSLYSLRDIQKITKKALIESMKRTHPSTEFKEGGPTFGVLVNIQEDVAEVLLDTSGEALHRRGYRTDAGEAPMKETLAAALVQLSFYDAHRVFIDPFCGSGTLAIEAAMIGRNMAPGLNRRFAFEHFSFIPKSLIKSTRKEVLQAIDYEKTLTIYASDVAYDMITIAKENAAEAGVIDDIHFQIADFRHLDFSVPNAVIVTNPPYGNRLGDGANDLEPLYKDLGSIIRSHTDHSYFVITPFIGFENVVGKRANKTRVLFNGRIKARFYQYHGPPPARDDNVTKA